ncbi:MAG: polymorphic toxin-type HINT domain-containing protein [Chloroflexota bacterium]
MAAAIGRGGLSRARGLPNSFSGDTLVATDHGERRIDGLRIGDRVLAYDEESGETSYQLVTATVSHQDAAIVRLMLDGQPLEATPEHPFSVQGRGWVHAEDLRPGDRVLRAFGGTGTVTSVTLKRHLQVMYNLSIYGAHTFFVGDSLTLVHNACRDSASPFGIFTNNRSRNIRNLDNAIQMLGGRWGCHTCGVRSPGPSGVWRMDHDPPWALDLPPYLIRPHCEFCSSRLGGRVKPIIEAYRRAARSGAPQETLDEILSRLPKSLWP